MRLLLSAMLAVSGWLIGSLAAQRRKNSGEELHRLAYFFEYAENEIRCKGVPLVCLIKTAKNMPQFQEFLKECDTTLENLHYPPCLEKTAMEEIRQRLKHLALETLQVSTETLNRCSEICHRYETEQKEKWQDVRKIYPRLGGCTGLLLAILLY